MQGRWVGGYARWAGWLNGSRFKLDVQRFGWTGQACLCLMGQGPVYVKLENEALRKLDPFLGENDTLYVNWVPTDQKIGRGGGYAGPVPGGM